MPDVSVSAIFGGLATHFVQSTFNYELHVCLFNSSPLAPYAPFSSPWLALGVSMVSAETHRITHGVASSTDTITKSPWNAINTVCSLCSPENEDQPKRLLSSRDLDINYPLQLLGQRLFSVAFMVIGLDRCISNGK